MANQVPRKTRSFKNISPTKTPGGGGGGRIWRREVVFEGVSRSKRLELLQEAQALVQLAAALERAQAGVEAHPAHGLGRALALSVFRSAKSDALL